MKISLCPLLRNVPGLEFVAQANDTVVEHGVALGWVGVAMKMAVVPAFVVQALLQLIKKRGESIDTGIVPAGRRVERRREHARGAGMGNHVVDLPTHTVELCPRLLKVALVR